MTSAPRQRRNDRGGEDFGEYLQHAARARGRRPAGDGRADRRRQVRHHVPGAGAADARHACRRRRRSRCRARARASSRAPAGRRSRSRAASLGDALKTRRTHVTADAEALIALPEIEVIVEATGDPGRRHPPCARRDRARQAHRHGQRRGRCAGGPAARAQGQGGGRGLQPRLGRPAGADLRARRLGAHLRLQGDRRRQGHALRAALSPLRRPTRCGTSSTSTCRSRIAARSIPKMFNSFVDGTKSGIEMTAVCNATGLVPQSEGLGFPPATRFELADVCKPKADGRHAGEGRRHRGGVVGRSRRPRRAASSRARHLRGVRGRERVRAPLLQANTPCCRTRAGGTPRSTGRST